MKNADYWRQRFVLLTEAHHLDADRYLAGLEALFLEAQQQVRADIEGWYARFARENGLSLSQARKLLTVGELEEFHWSVEQYIKVGKTKNLSPDWLRKLENASAKFHVSRLEAIQTQIQQRIEVLYGGQQDGLDKLLREIAGDGYTRTAYEVQKGIGMGWDIVALNEEKLSALLRKPWTTDGRTFSDRIWLQKQELIDAVQKNLTQGLLRGDAPRKLTDSIRSQFGVSRYQAGRLVHTETAWFDSVSTRQGYSDLGVDKVEIVTTLDSHTCPICSPLDGKIIPMSQYQPGVTVPPYHPNCRCCTAPALEDDLPGKRAARDDDDSPTYYVPSDMTYRDWKKSFVGKTGKTGLTRAARHATVKGRVL